MTHLYIEQNGITEEVSSSVISKLYELVSSGTLDGTSNLKGRLHTTLGYRSEIDYLNNTYPDLHIYVDDYAIQFEDSNMVTYLNSIGVGSNGMITESLAAAATIVANSLNTTVTKFNELKYFTNVTLSRDGLSGTSSGYARFKSWTALEEVDISNFTSLGHSNGAAFEDTFSCCTSLKKVTASNKLADIGHAAFDSCNELEEITGLPSNVTLHGGVCFKNCYKLKQSNFDNVVFTVNDSDSNNNMFLGCSLLTSLSFSGNFTNVKQSMFQSCSSLTSITGLGNVSAIGNSAFSGCSNLTTVDIDWPKITSVGTDALRNCSKLDISTLSLPLLTTINQYSFTNTKIQSISNLGSITSIPNNCFEGCSELTSVTLPNTITSLGANSFWKCSSLLSINIPSSCTTLSYSAFNQCTSLSGSLDLSNVTSIGEWCFSECSNVTISSFPKTSTYGQNTFKKIGNTSIVIPKEVTTIKNSCFQQCQSLQTLTFEQNSLITNILNNAFMGCTSLLNVILPEGLTTIGAESFRGCDGLYTVDISSTVTTINSMAFYEIGKQNNFANQTTVIFRGNTPPTCPSTNVALFGRGTTTQRATLTIYVPDAVVNTYKSLTYLSSYSDRIFGISQMPNS